MSIVGSAGSGLGGAGDIGGALGSFYSHTINQSLRFEDGDSATLDNSADTFASNGNLKTWTWSGWVKRGNFTNDTGTTLVLFSSGTNNDNRDYLGFSGDLLTFVQRAGGTTQSAVNTLAVFRDVSSWYNIQFVFDSTESASGDRFKIYVNGVQQTLTTSNEVEANRETRINKTGQHNIGSRRRDADDLFFDGYMADVVFVDGSALGPDSFGETKDGIWVPKDVSGLTFGQNGFHLDFADSSAIGNDVSGQNNDFAPSGGGSPTLVASDVVPDSPTNNFASLNPLNNPDGTFSEGNLKWTSTTTDQRIALATMPVDFLGTDDSYAEVRIGSKSSTYWAIGVFGNPKSWNPRVMYRNDGRIWRDGTNTQTGVGTFTEGDIMSITYDVSSGTVTFYKNNSSVTTETVGDTDNVQYFGCTSDSSGSSANYNWNFGQDSSFAGNETAQGNADANGQGDFYYTPPSGFLALCSANLPEPAIIDGSEYFNTVLWTGTGNDDLEVTGVGFSPSWSWMKRRDATGDQLFFDVVRGNGKQLKSAGSTNSPGTSAESTQSNKQKTFTADGFTLGTDATVNTNNGTYVAWNWLAGTSVSGNTTGSGTAKAYSGSVNAESGFSIITYKGNGTAGHTIPHNLTVGGVATAPTMAIFKNRDVNDQWAVYHKDILATHNLCLNDATKKADQDNRFNDTEPTGSAMTLGTGHVVNANDEDYIAYFFTDIDQYCKAGSYLGNGSSTDGTYIFTGFRPAWILVKRSENATGSYWWIHDNKRNTTPNGNDTDATLHANATTAESGLIDCETDFLSNGFKIRNNSNQANNSSGTYIYLAFAEQPFKYANAK